AGLAVQLDAFGRWADEFDEGAGAGLAAGEFDGSVRCERLVVAGEVQVDLVSRFRQERGARPGFLTGEIVSSGYELDFRPFRSAGFGAAREEVGARSGHGGAGLREHDDGTGLGGRQRYREAALRCGQEDPECGIGRVSPLEDSRGRARTEVEEVHRVGQLADGCVVVDPDVYVAG